MKGNLQRYVRTVMLISRWFLHKTRNVRGRISRENQKHILFKNLFWTSCHLWYNIVKLDRPHLTI